MRKFRLFKAFVIAFIMGVPLASQAMAQGVGGIVEGALGLTFGIIDLAGSS